MCAHRPSCPNPNRGPRTFAARSTRMNSIPAWLPCACTYRRHPVQKISRAKIIHLHVADGAPTPIKMVRPWCPLVARIHLACPEDITDKETERGVLGLELQDVPRAGRIGGHIIIICMFPFYLYDENGYGSTNKCPRNREEAALPLPLHASHSMV